MHRYTRPFGAVLIALFLSFSAVAGAAGAQAPPRPAIPVEKLIEAARAALAKGKPDDADFLLKGVRAGEGNIDDLDFLHGTIAMARRDWQGAIARFRAMLARNPDLPRVRLDLALAYFQAGENGNAAYHFRLSLGNRDLPALVRARALAMLDRIRRRKTWSVTGSLALAPDTNINAATSARTVNLLGLPARLSEDARQTSGVGLRANVSAGQAVRLAEDLRFRISAGLRTRTYSEDQFNERVLSARGGPRFLFDKFDLRSEMTVNQRRIGSDVYSWSNGLEISGNYLVGPAWRLSGSLGAERIAYEGFLGTGRIDSASLSLSHALGPATLLQADSAFRREVLEEDAYSWREFIVGVSARQELPLGFVLSGGPSYRWREYGAPLASLGPDARRDRTFSGRITVSNRNVELFGFMPEFTLRHERRESNLALYDYTRTAGELGVVRSF